jgi:hypothetical protein
MGILGVIKASATDRNTRSCKRIAIVTFGWPMGTVLYDFY